MGGGAAVGHESGHVGKGRRSSQAACGKGDGEGMPNHVQRHPGREGEGRPRGASGRATRKKWGRGHREGDGEGERRKGMTSVGDQKEGRGKRG